MRTGISWVSKDLGLKTFTLHKWEERGWLGTEPVLKDPNNNNQRVYSEEQMERIRFIKKAIEEQRKKGIKRTDFGEMEKLLLEEFGGEVTTIEEGTLEILPATVEAFQQLLINQNKEMAQLRDMVAQMQLRELPTPVDHTSEIEAIKKQTEGIMTKDQAETLISRLAEEEKSKKEIENELKLLKSKLDIAVEYIQKQETTEKTEKRGFFKRIFG